jgi:hypothetical protein
LDLALLEGIVLGDIGLVGHNHRGFLDHRVEQEESEDETDEDDEEESDQAGGDGGIPALLLQARQGFGAEFDM